MITEKVGSSKILYFELVNNWDITHRVYEGLSVHLKPKNLIASSVFFFVFFSGLQLVLSEVMRVVSKVVKVLDKLLVQFLLI